MSEGHNRNENFNISLSTHLRVEKEVYLSQELGLFFSLVGGAPSEGSEQRVLLEDGGLVGHLDRGDGPTLGRILAIIDVFKRL